MAAHWTETITLIICLLLEKLQTPGSASDKYSTAWLLANKKVAKQASKISFGSVKDLFQQVKMFAALWLGVTWERPVLTHYVPFTIYLSS